MNIFVAEVMVMGAFKVRQGELKLNIRNISKDQSTYVLQ